MIRQLKNNRYRLGQNIVQVPWDLLEVEHRVLRPNFRARDPSSSQITEYVANLRGYIYDI